MDAPDSAEAARPARTGTPFRGGLFTLMVLRVSDPKDQGFFQTVMDTIGQAPGFFRHAPIVLDLQDLADAAPFNIAELVRRLRQHLVVPVAVQNGTEDQNKTAVNAGLSILPEGHAPPQRQAPAEERRARPQRARPAAAQDDAPTGSGPGALVVQQPVRSGRQVYAQKGDLIVLASIGAGAELLADGHIHVYGVLRGRAHAGVAGDTNARIFCRSLEAELVSIAGFWRVREDMPEDLIGKPVQIHLDGERLIIEPSA